MIKIYSLFLVNLQYFALYHWMQGIKSAGIIGPIIYI